MPIHFRYFACLLLCLAGMAWLALSPPAFADGLPQDKTAAVIVAYERVGEDEYPLTNVATDTFAAQLRELKSGAYHVLPLPMVVHLLRSGAKLPSRTVVLSFDGGHRSVLVNAVPLLLQNNLPFTLFVATDQLDANSPDSMNWDDLKKLGDSKLVTIGLHPAGAGRLDNAAPEEIRRQINDAKARLRTMLGVNTNLFAYPSGQYSAAYRTVVASSGFDAAFGLQSGVAYGEADPYTLPRFLMTDSYGDMDRFRMTVNALPLPVTDLAPADPLLKTARPNIGFTADVGLATTLSHLVCFVAGQGKPDVQTLGRNRVEIRLQDDLTDAPSRINCILPGPAPAVDEEQRWRWFGISLSPPVAAAGAGDDDNQDMPQEQNNPGNGG